MSKAQHTRGPWHFLEEDGPEDEGNVGRPLTICDPDLNDLANVYSSDDSTVSISRAEAIANASLIAAGPDLLAMLKHAVRWHDQLSDGDIARYEAVIAKAERTV